jgi:syntaxin-binding protein 1
MAQSCMDIFEKEKLPDIATVEQVFLSCSLSSSLLNYLQSCGTGLTSEGKVPKGLVEEMVPLLDSRTVM